MMSFRRLLVLTLACVPAASAHAYEGERLDDGTTTKDGPTSNLPTFRSTFESGDSGTFLPFGLPAHMNKLGYAVSSGGYDSTRRTGIFGTDLEARILGPVALRLGTEYSPDTARMRPSVGLRVAILSELKNGLDLAAGIRYRSEGFTETEGEIEGALAIGARIRSLMLLGNLAYGQDPEGRERDGELRFALLTRLGSRVLVGLDSRARLNLASNGAGPNGEPRFDAVGGPAATVVVGPVGLLLNGGGSVVQLSGGDPIHYGAYVMGGLGLGL
jgi:hypothetical protein